MPHHTMILEVFDYEPNNAPISVFEKVRNRFQSPMALLESALTDKTSPFSFIAFDPVQEVISSEGSFEKIRSALKKAKKFPQSFHLSGGLIGYFNWEVFEEIDPRKNPNDKHAEKKSATKPPHALFYEFSRFFIFDNHEEKIFAIQTHAENAEKFHQENLEILTPEKKNKARPLLSVEKIQDEKNIDFSVFASENTQAIFEEKVSWAQNQILNGEAFQMIVSNGFKTQTQKDGLDFYAALRSIEPTTHLFFLDFGEHGQVAGASPEVLGAKRASTVHYSPIAGTRFRGKDRAEDEFILEEMCADTKENAEHDMLLDLGRNDLGRVCQTGSIKVVKEKYAKRFANLMHLVSDLEGTLKPEYDAIDFFQSIFPAGTLSGAPKIRAIDLIDQIEPHRRDLYGGAVGYFSADGDMEFCIAIRSFALKDGIFKFRTGAGIVSDSIPKNEWLEVHNKAKSLCKVFNYVEKNSRKH
jgi:anthranilate synthase component I